MLQNKRTIAPARFLVLCGLLTVVVLILVCLLPHSRYLRFTALADVGIPKAGWIYERIHFDPQPIDVVFIGTSHTLNAVDSAVVETGYQQTTGRQLNVVNFALEHFGRDNQYLLARETLMNRPIKLLVLEVTDEEERALHPAFGSMADVVDLLDAPILINTSYLLNLSHLPMRQLSLFWNTVLRASDGKRFEFNLKNYLGSHWDSTFVTGGSREHPIPGRTPRLRAPGKVELERERLHYQHLQEGKLRLPSPFRSFEQRANLVYLRKTIELAQAHHVSVRFLFLPSYAAKLGPSITGGEFANIPIWYPREALREPEWWFDVNHVNYYGAMQVSHWLVGQLVNENLAETQLR